MRPVAPTVDGMVIRRAVVTGASSGIGEATVRVLRAQGWEVVGVARREKRLAALAAETGASAVACDLTDPDAVDSLVAELERTGPVHALVQVAGGARGTDSVEQGSVDDWQWMYDANVLATQRLVAVTPREGRSGPLVFVEVETDYRNQRGEAVARHGMTFVFR